MWHLHVHVQRDTLAIPAAIAWQVNSGEVARFPGVLHNALVAEYQLRCAQCPASGRGLATPELSTCSSDLD